jgi:[protein-PII] uridylyltransferase
MAHISQRRDLTDPDVIARFAERIGSEDRLTKLYLLTLCDTAMTNPENLNAWKAGLLRELVIRTGRYFRGESLRSESPESDSEAREREQREKIVQVASGDGALASEVAREFVEGIDPRLISQLTSRQAARHVRLVAGARGKQPPVAVEVHCFPMRGHSEVSIVAPDAPGVLAAIAGALTANRVDVLGAFLGHIDLPDGPRLVTDTFYVRDLKGEAISDDDARWARLAGDLRELLAGPPDPAAVHALIAKRRPRSGMPKRRTPGVPTEIRLHDDSSQATIVEVFTQDRVGVLHAITQTLADLGLDISLAKVSTEGEKVADAFYVHRGGQPITDAAAREMLLARLRAALEAPELTGG